MVLVSYRFIGMTLNFNVDRNRGLVYRLSLFLFISFYFVLCIGFSLNQTLAYSYDSDFNHAPCLRNGHKAHWAVIIGCLIDDQNRVNIYDHSQCPEIILHSVYL